MGTQQTDGLNWDQDGKYTMGYFGNRGDATSNWYVVVRAFNGGIVPLGAVSDAAAVTGDGTAIALLKAIRAVAKREDDTHASLDYGFPAWAVANQALSAFGANGDYSPIATGVGGELFATPTPPMNATIAAAVATTPVASVAAAASLVLKNSAGTLYRLTVVNNNASAQFVHLYNATSLPADGAVPAWVGKVPALDSRDFVFQDFGKRFTTGIVVGNSSTMATKTVGAADCWFSGEVK